ncbi:hypothetical protein Tco_0528781 [Tanacetum coccineum]
MSIIKTKAARYEIEGIKDMVPTLWSPTKVGYDKDALKGVKHWGEGRVKSVSVKKLQGYGHLEEIMVKRADRQFYKFKEGSILNICQEWLGVNFTDEPKEDSKQTLALNAFLKLITGRKTDQDVKTCHFPNSPRLKFVRIGEDYQEYGLSIPETMLTEAIKQSESYQMFINYSTGQIPPKKSRGKGSQRKKTTDDSQETVDVSEESKPEPEPVKRKTSSKRRAKKKITLPTDDNIIFDGPDTALELGKSISKTNTEKAKAARQVHATHARIMTESVFEPTRRRKSGKVTSDPPKKLKGVPDGSTVISATSSEGTSTKPRVPDEEKDITKENFILKWGSEQESEYSKEDKLDEEEKDDKEGDADDEDDETEYDEKDI